MTRLRSMALVLTLALAAGGLASGCGPGIKAGTPAIIEARTAPAGFAEMQQQDGQKMIEQGARK